MPRFLIRSETPMIVGSGALLATALAFGLVSPALFGAGLIAAVAAGTGFLALRFPAGFSVAWLWTAGLTLEMTFHDLAGPDTFQPVIAVIKGTQIGLAGLCMIRFGPKADPLNPARAFPVMLVTGLVHGLYPHLSAADSLRSTIGSIAPFAFCFCRMPACWAEAMIRATKWAPAIAVLASLPFAAAGIRPLFVDSGGARLAGLGHPAFLAGVCLPAIYACLIQLFRHGRGGDLALLAVNFLILTLTGARAPFVYAVAVTGLSLVSIRSAIFPAGQRLLLILTVLGLLPVLVLLAGGFDEIRLFNVFLHETANLSGRDLLWPSFQDAAARSPWFGWGTGAGNAVVSPQGRVAQNLHTWAAHNEYLRIQVEGGAFGEGLLIVLSAGWAIVHTRGLPAPERRIMRLALLALGLHAITDNVLISTPACVFFAFAAAVFARGDLSAAPE